MATDKPSQAIVNPSRILDTSATWLLPMAMRNTTSCSALPATQSCHNIGLDPWYMTSCCQANRSIMIKQNHHLDVWVYLDKTSSTTWLSLISDVCIFLTGCFSSCDCIFLVWDKLWILRDKQLSMRNWHPEEGSKVCYLFFFLFRNPSVPLFLFLRRSLVLEFEPLLPPEDYHCDRQWICKQDWACPTLINRILLLNKTNAK